MAKGKILRKAVMKSMNGGDDDDKVVKATSSFKKEDAVKPKGKSYTVQEHKSGDDRKLKWYMEKSTRPDRRIDDLATKKATEVDVNVDKSLAERNTTANSEPKKRKKSYRSGAY